MKRDGDKDKEYQLAKYEEPKLISFASSIDTVKMAVVDAEDLIVDQLVNKATPKLDLLVDGSGDRISGKVMSRLAEIAKERVIGNFQRIEASFESLDFAGIFSSDTAA